MKMTLSRCGDSVPNHGKRGLPLGVLVQRLTRDLLIRFPNQYEASEPKWQRRFGQGEELASLYVLQQR